VISRLAVNHPKTAIAIAVLLIMLDIVLGGASDCDIVGR
jgi:hypothetical protein